ncbi:hypothetical protein [Rhizobium lusitanum]|nr:hypothetical protein [Rhizobium lusitanum]NTJ11785.1 hypothetical protein [Rhizobium lusitanum]
MRLLLEQQATMSTMIPGHNNLKCVVGIYSFRFGTAAAEVLRVNFDEEKS